MGNGEQINGEMMLVLGHLGHCVEAVSPKRRVDDGEKEPQRWVSLDQFEIRDFLIPGSSFVSGQILVGDHHEDSSSGGDRY